MQNPKLLKEKVQACRTSMLKNSNVNLECQKVFDAGESFTELLMNQQREPQLFGENILHAQMKKAKLDKEIQALGSDPAKKSEVNKLKQQKIKTQNKIKIYLAIVGLGSP